MEGGKLDLAVDNKNTFPKIDIPKIDISKYIFQSLLYYIYKNNRYSKEKRQLYDLRPSKIAFVRLAVE